MRTKIIREKSMGKCNKPCKKTCETKITITELPYLIDSPGSYCLCRDFVIQTPSSLPLIQITSDDVKLDFHTRSITLASPSNLPVILVNNPNSQLNNISLKNINISSQGTAIATTYGIKVSNARNLKICNATLNNLGSVNSVNPLTDNFALYVENSSELDISNVKIINDNGTGSSVLLYNSINVQYQNNKAVNARTRFVSLRNVHINQLQVDNTNSGTGSKARCLQIDSAFNASVAPVAFTQNVQIENSELISNENGFGIVLLGLRAASTPGPYDYRVKNVTVKNNAIRSGNGIEVQYIQGYTVANNQLNINGGNGILVDGCENGGVVADNMVSGENGKSGIIVFQTPIAANLTAYNTVKDNQVSNFVVGYADNDLLGIGPASVATCTVFKDNVGSGNTNNSSFISPSTTSVNNIFTC